MSKGILCFAVNNGTIDYVKQAKFLAKRAKEYLDLPVSIVTNIDLTDNIFDQIIKISDNDFNNNRRYYNGNDDYKILNFRNDSRPLAYELTPYDETIVLDTDYVICSNNLLRVFERKENFIVHDTSCDIAIRPSTGEFQFVSDAGIKFYWATCVFFRKTGENKIFFDLLKHIQENWDYYVVLYGLNVDTYRNDHAFSIAIHIMNGYEDANWHATFNNPIHYTTDRDFLHKIDGETVKSLVAVPGEINYLMPVITRGVDLHVMNKYSLGEHLDV